MNVTHDQKTKHADAYATNEDLVAALIAQWTKVADRHGKAITVLHGVA